MLRFYCILLLQALFSVSHGIEGDFANFDIEQKLSLIFERLERIERKVDLPPSKKPYSKLNFKKDEKAEVNHPSLRGKNFSLNEEELGIKDDHLSYNYAISLMKSGKQEEAESQFDSFVASFPSSKLVSGANYYIGEINFNQKKYQDASVAFLKSYMVDQSGDKSTLCLLRLATCLREIKKFNQACSVLKKLEAYQLDKKMKQIIAEEQKLLKDYC